MATHSSILAWKIPWTEETLPLELPTSEQIWRSPLGEANPFLPNRGFKTRAGGLPFTPPRPPPSTPPPPGRHRSIRPRGTGTGSREHRPTHQTST